MAAFWRMLREGQVKPIARLGALVALVLCAASASVSASAATLVVTVRDQAGEPIPTALVVIRGSEIVHETTPEGVVEILGLSNGSYEIRVFADGFQVPGWQPVEVRGRTPLDVTLALTTFESPGLTVIGDPSSFRWAEPELPFSTVENTREKIQRVPGTFNDPFRSLHVLPGVTAVNDLSGLVRVRGGSPDQNLYLVDGITLHNPYRMRIIYGGGVSMFNLDVVDDIAVHAGGFSARYGNRLAAAIEVSTREGDRRRTNYQANASLVSANAVVEGPTPRVNGSWLVSARRTYYDLALAGSADPGTTLPNFYDVQAKTVIDLDASKQIVAHGFFGREKTDVTTDEFLSFSGETTTFGESESSLGALTYRLRAGDQTVFEIRGSYFHDQNVVLLNEDSGRIADLKTSDFGPRFRTDVIASAGAGEVRFGTELNWSQYSVRWARDDGAPGFYFSTPDSLRLQGRRSHTGLYGEYLRSLKRVNVSIGLRADETSINDERAVSPRITTAWRLGNGWTATFAGGVFYQAPEPTLVFGRERGYDFSNNLSDLDSERAEHTNVGLEWSDRSALRVKLEGYYRDLSHQLVPRDQVGSASSDGHGFASGFEFSIDRGPAPGRRWDGFASYGYTHARVRGGIHDEWTRPAGHSYHNAATSVRCRVFRGLALSTMISFTSGAAYASLTGRIPDTTNSGDVSWTPVYDTRNANEWPDYFRWDVRFEAPVTVFGRSGQFFVEVLNVSDRQNVTGVWYNAEYSDHDVLSSLPRIPSVGISIGGAR